MARLLAVTAALVAGACGDDPQAPAVARVTVKTFDFQPDPLEVETGTRITFANADKINHSVTSGTRDEPTPESFEGVMAGAGDTYELSLDRPGSYDYFCKFHPGEGMTGRIVVR